MKYYYWFFIYFVDFLFDFVCLGCNGVNMFKLILWRCIVFNFLILKVGIVGVEYCYVDGYMLIDNDWDFFMK